ncbi:MAG TPA: helix-turn-helix transcriptional regulator [bacterium]|nr:helix-turn-helix transcriptional regulator [bacterium]
MEKRFVVDLRRAFGKRVQEARHATRLSQAQLARQLGLRSGVAVGDWERGKALPKFETFLRLCEALNHPPAFFIEGYRDRPQRDPAQALQHGLESLEQKSTQRHLELLHRLEHLPVEVGRSIAPEELRSALERMRFEDAAPVAEARLRAALSHRRGGGDEDPERAVAREALRQGWDAAREALRDWLQQRGKVV